MAARAVVAAALAIRAPDVSAGDVEQKGHVGGAAAVGVVQMTVPRAIETNPVSTTHHAAA